MPDLQRIGNQALQKAPQPLRRALDGIPLQFRQESGPTSPMAGGLGPGNSGMIAGVEKGNPNTVSVMQPDVFEKNADQLATHEALHNVQNNWAPAIQAAIPPDNPNDPYNYGGTAAVKSLLAKGGTIANMPREQGAAALQYGQSQGNPEPYASLAKTIDDVPRSQIEMTDPMAKTLNMHPRTPQVPPSSVPGMNFAKEIYQPGQPAPGDTSLLPPDMVPTAQPAPAPMPAPDALQQNIARDQQQLQKVNFAQKNPWGTANNHPGTMGKIAHVLSVAGNIAGNIVAPNVMAAIPGTQLNMASQSNGLTHRLNAETEEQSQNQSRNASTQATQLANAAEPQKTADAHGLSTATQANLDSETTARNTKQPDLATAYAHRVNEVLAQGGDPSKDHVANSLADAITSIQKQPVDPKTSHDDAYIKNLVQDNLAKGMNQHQAEEAAYKQFTKETKIDPGVARTSVMLQMPTAVADPNNPGGVVYTTRKDAIGKGAPTGIDTKVPLATAQDFSHGKDATTLTNINTADAHIAQLRKIGEALHNGNVQLANQLGNAYATATGAAAPLNFQLLKTALAAEIGKTTTGGVATVEETKELTKALNAANSPAQLYGVTDQAHQLMQSKKNMLHQQYTQGMHGKPNFDNPAESGPQSGAVEGGYRFKGGNAGDPKNWEKVQ